MKEKEYGAPWCPSNGRRWSKTLLLLAAIVVSGFSGGNTADLGPASKAFFVPKRTFTYLYNSTVSLPDSVSVTTGKVCLHERMRSMNSKQADPHTSIMYILHRDSILAVLVSVKECVYKGEAF